MISGCSFQGFHPHVKFSDGAVGTRFQVCESLIQQEGVELLVNKPLLNVAGYMQCRTNEGCTYVH